MVSEATMTEAPENTATTDVQPLLPDLGLEDNVRTSVATVLTKLLADEYVLYTILRKYHWNVTGPQFFALHEAFEQQYDLVAPIVDEVAERIRQYGEMAIGTLEEFQEHTRLTEQPGVNPDARQMVADVMAIHETLVRHLRADIDAVDELDDDGAEDFLTGLLQQHQEMAWMMRAMLEGMSV